MSELSALSGVPVNRIRYYIRKGVLPEGTKVNRTTALYTDEHLAQLQLLKEGQAPGGVSASRTPPADAASRPEPPGALTVDGGPRAMQDAIAVSAIPLFRRKGFERVTISDITEAARISRNTFYQYFGDKKELFIACLTKLFLEWRREAPDGTTPVPETIKTLALAFYRVYPRWSDMMNLFRASATKDPEEFGPRLEDSMNVRIGPITADIERGIAAGLFRDVDARLAAMGVAGQLDYVFYFLSRGAFPGMDPEEVVERALDIFFNGVGKR
ncbi:MAG: TetR family transcriptional regulator [Deferrisomatales bacterium]|nr:TetR family transcriptional regulator [Deferrisomatales bacterium]